MNAPSVVIELNSFETVRQAYRIKCLRQAMYTEGGVVMADCLLDLHGDDHRQRRRLENRLFRREVFAHWEHEVLGHTIALTLAPFAQAGHGDLTAIGYRSAMNLTALIAGVDHDPTNAAETERLYEIVKKFSEGATLVHSTRNRHEVRDEVRAAMEVFQRDWLEASIQRRAELITSADETHLPRDVLTTLLRNRDSLPLPDDVLVREICFYLQAGAHSTANAFTHTVDEIFGWCDANPERLHKLRADRLLVQRCVHESLRLNPASPVAWRTALEDHTMTDGTFLPQGSRVVLDLTAANRDPSVFGDDAHLFDPNRSIPQGIPAWGHSFGGGMHACIGAELDGGLEQPDHMAPDSEAAHLFGTVAVMTHALLDAGGRPDPERPAVLDPGSERRHFSQYPVVFS